MAVLKVQVLVDVDDVPITSFVLTRRVTYTNVESISSTRATGAGFTTLPTGEITQVQALIITADQTIAVGPNNQSAQTVTVNPNGILVLLDGIWGIPLVQNNSGNPAQIRAIVAGT